MSERQQQRAFSAAAPVNPQNEQKIGLFHELHWTGHQHFELRGNTRQQRLAPTSIRHNRFVYNSYSRGNGKSGKSRRTRLDQHAHWQRRYIVRGRCGLHSSTLLHQAHVFTRGMCAAWADRRGKSNCSDCAYAYICVETEHHRRSTSARPVARARLQV